MNPSHDLQGLKKKAKERRVEKKTILRFCDNEEVAIRKINGAGIKQIILLFSRLYMLLLTTSALLAFPVVYVILHMWKEIYQIFFNDGILYWVGIFVGVTLLTALTVIFRILRIVRLNPAEVIKNE